MQRHAVQMFGLYIIPSMPQRSSRQLLLCCSVWHKKGHGFDRRDCRKMTSESVNIPFLNDAECIKTLSFECNQVMSNSRRLNSWFADGFVGSLWPDTCWHMGDTRVESLMFISWQVLYNPVKALRDVHQLWPVAKSKRRVCRYPQYPHCSGTVVLRLWWLGWWRGKWRGSGAWFLHVGANVAYDWTILNVCCHMLSRFCPNCLLQVCTSSSKNGAPKEWKLIADLRAERITSHCVCTLIWYYAVWSSLALA